MEYQPALMLLLWTSLTSHLVAQTSKLPPALQDCMLVHNITIPEDQAVNFLHVLSGNRLTAVEYNYEPCLYYVLAEKAFENGQSLRHTPPWAAATERADAKPLDINIGRLFLTEFTDPDAKLSGIRVKFFIWTLDWHDARLSWIPSEWDFEKTIRIENPHRNIWMPNIVVDANSDERTITETPHGLGAKVNYDGGVNATLFFESTLDCNVDFSRFPSDQHECCVRLAAVDAGAVKLRSEFNYARIIHERLMENVWDVKHVEIRSDHDQRFGTDSLDICLYLARKSGVLRLEISLPMLVCMVIVSLVPFFGNLALQTYVKLFALLLELVALDMLSNVAPREAFAAHTPNIYRFYEFTVVVTTVSLIVTVMFGAMARLPQKVPPSHSLYLLASMLNKHVCCVDTSSQAVHVLHTAHNYERHMDEPEQPPDSARSGQTVASNGTNSAGGGPTHPAAAAESTDYTADWTAIYTSLNGVISVALTGGYLLGVLAIMIW